MKSKGLWIHKNSMDIFYEVLAVYDVHPDYIKVKYNCWNINEFGQPYLVPYCPYKGKVYKEDLIDWRRYEDNR